MDITISSSFSFDVSPLPHFRGLRHLVFAMLESNSFLNFDLLRSRMIGVLSPEAACDPQFWKTQLLPITIGLLGTTVGTTPLHCACLDRNGAGLLIAGNSGVGKSTLTAALAKRGFAVVSDDCTFVSRHSGKLVAHGLFAPLKLLPDSIRYFPELHDSRPAKTLNGEIAHEIDPEKSLSAEWKSHSMPKYVLLLERTSARGCRFVPCQPELLREFFRHSFEKLPPELPDAARTRSGIVDQLLDSECWILRTGEDPMHTAAAIDDFLQEA